MKNTPRLKIKQIKKEEANKKDPKLMESIGAEVYANKKYPSWNH